MELLSICNSSTLCGRIDCSNWKFDKKFVNLNQPKFLIARKPGLLSHGSILQLQASGTLGPGYTEHIQIESSDSQEGSRLLALLNDYQSSLEAKSLSENCNCYVADGSDNLTTADGLGVDVVTKILIPGLPDESDENQNSPIIGCFWDWKPNMSVHYEKSGMQNIQSPAVLFLPGFGVGSFHYEKQLKDLGREYRVWALDFLGQGMSMPSADPAPLAKDTNNQEANSVLWGFGQQAEPWANELVYSVDLWKDQVCSFIEEVIGEPVYIVGNSLGGYVAAYFAACNPQLVKGVTLLNATPFWGFLPNPSRSPRLSKIFPWAGTFPLPAILRKIIELMWQKISDPQSIQEVLKQVYADHSTKVDKVFYRIIETTQHPAAAASLVSIMFAPTGELSFEESLSRCQMQNVPICLLYGKEDPWVKPIWGRKVKQQIPEATYYEMSPAGHCPHDEVPEVVNYLLRGWIGNLESQGSHALPLLDDFDATESEVSKDLEFVKEGFRKSVRVRLIGSKVSVWERIGFFMK